jgi:hypothetical protein
MRSIVKLIGTSSVEKLKKIVSQVEVLANQPQLEVHHIYKDKNPQLLYREILVDESKYQVIDIGYMDGVPETVSLGSKIYSEEDVEKLSI